MPQQEANLRRGHLFTFPETWGNQVPLRAFLGTSSLVQVTAPDRITSIGDSAFCRCENLVHFEFPATLTSIGNQAFGR
jgi:hypothetical protein